MFFLEKFRQKKEILADKKAQFTTIQHSGVFTITMQDETIYDCTEQELIECIEEMFAAPAAKKEFIVLTAPKPQKDIVYIQACTVDDWVEVEIGVEKGKKITLLYKMCTKQECMNLFLSFYQYPVDAKGFDIDITEFAPVLF